MGLRRSLASRVQAGLHGSRPELTLQDSSRIAVLGGGPAGSLFAYFARRMGAVVDLDLQVDIFEARAFSQPGPGGCNHCGGIVSESLVQLLATEGINLPEPVVQRGIDSYVLHLDVGSVRIASPRHEKRIAALYRGDGPLGVPPGTVRGLDSHLLDLAVSSGARVHRKLVTGIDWKGAHPAVACPDGTRETYDLVVVAAGVNSHLLDALPAALPGNVPPRCTTTYICEFALGRETVERCLGSSMHVFLLDIPRLEFAALIPKRDHVTLCLLGENIDEELVGAFREAPEVRACLPGGQSPAAACHCFPRINVREARQPWGDRIVAIGDSGVARLYKDGIGSAYRTAKAAARAAVYAGISAEDFRRHYGPTCQSIARDNTIGHAVFAASGILQRLRPSRRAMLRMTAREQAGAGQKRLSTVLWDMFSGSAPYREILTRACHPAFVASLLWNLAASNVPGARHAAGMGGSDG